MRTYDLIADMPVRIDEYALESLEALLDAYDYLDLPAARAELEHPAAVAADPVLRWG